MEETLEKQPHEERYEAETLSEELRQLDSATDGQTIEGVITEVPDESDGDTVTLTVKTVLGEFTETFEKPKPPVDDYKLTEFADEYGQGLADIAALEGEAVDCTYDEHTDSFEISLPKSRSQRLREWVERQTTSDSAGEYNRFSESPGKYLIITVIWPFLMLLSLTDLVGDPVNDQWYNYGHANLRSLIWAGFVIGLALVLLF